MIVKVIIIIAIVIGILYFCETSDETKPKYDKSRKSDKNYTVYHRVERSTSKRVEDVEQEELVCTGVIDRVNWNVTKDGQLQRWLTIDDGHQKYDMSKYIVRTERGVIEQYDLLKPADYIRVHYHIKDGYLNISKLQVLKRHSNF